MRTYLSQWPRHKSRWSSLSCLYRSNVPIIAALPTNPHYLKLHRRLCLTLHISFVVWGLFHRICMNSYFASKNTCFSYMSNYDPIRSQFCTCYNSAVVRYAELIYDLTIIHNNKTTQNFYISEGDLKCLYGGPWLLVFVQQCNTFATRSFRWHCVKLQYIHS